ncbi:MAG: glycoside hydrolase family 3 C-terminal domain-containing protein [Arachnia propionica]|uniref:glycoside hydrolase family 3 C-terminal domain-containing protein n=1 Tax=Arachnia propionica TaxID=1750 RepID=UPI00270A5A39|nr:glycoside hydrolase family 3 C-terminal domain-containing protein [Arachnia propionica]
MLEVVFDDDAIPQLLDRLTLEEKCSLLSGSDFWHTEPIERLDIPALMLTDGPHGVRKQSQTSEDLDVGNAMPATCFPTAAGLASTWDRDLVAEIGHALGRECRALGVHVLLGPGVNIKRTPLCGRNFEYFSEDPLLAGELATCLVRGIEAEGIGTSVKHFAANNQETDRMRINVEVDERTLREIYLAPFERVVTTANPATLMCSYNRINGAYSSENPWLLTRVLRDEWGFDGLVMTDWGAVNDRVAGVRGGLDLEMPSSQGLNDHRVAEAVRRGDLSEDTLDRAVARVLRLVARHHQPVEEHALDLDAHHDLACRAAAASAVLLKNDQETLPLSGLDDVVVIGELARTPRYQGAGSSRVNPTRLVSILEALRERAAVPFEPGYVLADSPTAGSDDEILHRAAATAARGRTAVLVLGLPSADESEGYDRNHIDLPASHVRLLREVSEVAERTVVLLANGSAVATAPWQHAADAILELWLGGQGGGEGAARLLTGEVSPSGRLAETIPLRVEQLPAQLNFPGENGVVRYGEGLFIGYRGLQALGAHPSFPFGHGLTYTSFSYSDLVVEAAEVTPELPLTAPVLRVTFTVTNSGDRHGVAVPQLYLGHPTSAFTRPVRELRGFSRLGLEPGKSEPVTITVDRRTMSLWHTLSHSWQVEPGPVTVEIGESSADIRLSATATITTPSLRPPLTHWSTLREWRADPMAWPTMREALGEFGKLMDGPGEINPEAFFLLDLPACKATLMFNQPTATQLDDLVARFGA